MAVIGLMLMFTLAAAQAEVPQATPADTITPPPVPDGLGVEPGNEAFLVGHGVGTQNYVCLPCDPTKPDCPLGVSFKLFTPQATLFDDAGEQLTTHFFGPNPSENGVIRVAWEHSRDTSTVWAQLVKASSDSDFVKAGAIPWLLLNVKDTGAQAGPTGGDKLTKTTFIQRLNTSGGVAPVRGCLRPSIDVGNQQFVPYTADYFFYRAAGGSN